jgi:hypothetical protein
MKVAHVRLCRGLMLFVRPCQRKMQEMVFDAHDRAFTVLKGTCPRAIYDNMKTAVEASLRRRGPPLSIIAASCRSVVTDV